MSFYVTITPPPNYPDVKELISSFAHCPGNIYTAVIALREKELKEMERSEAMDTLSEVINEVDKGDAGLFSNAYAVNADLMWSEGRETQEEWKALVAIWSTQLCSQPFKSYNDFCGYKLRSDLREVAIRFFLYYTAGYSIEYN